MRLLLAELNEAKGFLCFCLQILDQQRQKSD